MSCGIFVATNMKKCERSGSGSGKPGPSAKQAVLQEADSSWEYMFLNDRCFDTIYCTSHNESKPIFRPAGCQVVPVKAESGSRGICMQMTFVRKS